MFNFDDETDEAESNLEGTYTVTVDGGRKVIMTGDPRDLDKITSIMREYGNEKKPAAAPDLLAACEEARYMLSLIYSVGVVSESEAQMTQDAISQLNAAIAAAKPAA